MESRVAAESCPESHHSISTKCAHPRHPCACVCLFICVFQRIRESEPNQYYITDWLLSVACISVTLHCLKAHSPSNWAAELPFVSNVCKCKCVSPYTFQGQLYHSSPHWEMTIAAHGEYNMGIPQIKVSFVLLTKWIQLDLT